MTGVVLCGGQSSRMGKDKGMLEYGPVSGVQLAASKLESLGLPVVLSVNAQQYGAYGAAFPNFPLVKDDPGFAIGGPLKGILSVHLQYPAEDLLVVACDMPALQPEVLQHLNGEWGKRAGDALAFRNNDSVEPLCALYASKGLAEIGWQYMQGMLRRFGLKQVLEGLDTGYLPLPPAWEKSFYNCNTPADLLAL